jgi:hypothetical protein
VFANPQLHPLERALGRPGHCNSHPIFFKTIPIKGKSSRRRAAPAADYRFIDGISELLWQGGEGKNGTSGLISNSHEMGYNIFSSFKVNYIGVRI